MNKSTEQHPHYSDDNAKIHETINSFELPDNPDDPAAFSIQDHPNLHYNSPQSRINHVYNMLFEVAGKEFSDYTPERIAFEFGHTHPIKIFKWFTKGEKDELPSFLDLSLLSSFFGCGLNYLVFGHDYEAINSDIMEVTTEAEEELATSIYNNFIYKPRNFSSTIEISQRLSSIRGGSSGSLTNPKVMANEELDEIIVIDLEGSEVVLPRLYDNEENKEDAHEQEFEDSPIYMMKSLVIKRYGWQVDVAVWYHPNTVSIHDFEQLTIPYDDTDKKPKSDSDYGYGYFPEITCLRASTNDARGIEEKKIHPLKLVSSLKKACHKESLKDSQEPL